MSLLARREDFEPANEAEGTTALYYSMSDGKHIGYEATEETFHRRCEALNRLWQPCGQSLAVWGCGWGWLVSLLVENGYNAHGFDASDYAITTGRERFPKIVNRLHLRNALDQNDVNASQSDIDLHNTRRFYLLLTEDLLPCLDDDEIEIVLPLLRTCSLTSPVHIVTPGDGNGDSRVNWKTYEEWKLLVAPDTLLGADGKAV